MGRCAAQWALQSLCFGDVAGGLMAAVFVRSNETRDSSATRSRRPSHIEQMS